jgi:hypothetical protein
MICSSVNLLFFMSVILQGLTDFSTLSWYGWQGAGHSYPMHGFCVFAKTQPYAT